MQATLKHAIVPNPQVSVIMAAHNAESYIGAAMDSVLAQTGIALELIVADDASTDRTLAVVTARDNPALTVLGIPHNVGAASARNLAVAHARAPWLCVFDADDLMQPGMLAPYFRAVTAHHDAFWAYCGLELMDAGGAPTGSRMATPFDPIKLLQVNYIPHPMSLFRRNVFDLVGGYAPELRRSEDYDLWLRFTELGDAYFHPPVGVLYRRGDDAAHRQDMNDTVRRRLRRRLTEPAVLPGQAARRSMLTRGLALLDAVTAEQWPTALRYARKLLEIGVDSPAFDQLAIKALAAMHWSHDALALAVRRLQATDLTQRIVREQWIWFAETALDLATRCSDRAAISCLREYVALNPVLKKEIPLDRPN